jgi:DNA-binding NarL/FixJ family response regulator
MFEPPKPLQVYIVEDSAIIRRLIASTIEAAGAELVGHSAEAAAAIAELAVLRPDLVVIDIGLKSGTGFDVLEALQKSDARPQPIKVVLTNHANDDYRRMSLRLGANGFFDKSSEMSQVLALISALAAEKQQRWNAGRPPTRQRDSGSETCH